MNVSLRWGILAGTVMTLLGGCSSETGSVVQHQDGGTDMKTAPSDSSEPSRDGASTGDVWTISDVPATAGDGPGIGDSSGPTIDGPIVDVPAVDGPAVDRGDASATTSDGPTGSVSDGAAIIDAPLGSPDVISADSAIPAGCTLCHGSDVSPAPPRDSHGNTATTSPGVGAHQQHLATSTWHASIACGECHIVPTLPTYDTNVPTHMNGQDDLVWGPLARQGTFDATTYGCSGTYCHGGSLLEDAAGTTTIRAPIWTKVDGTQNVCGMACHSTPPGGVHPASQSCESCHGQVIASFVPGTPPVVAWTNPAMHINGTVDVSALTCTSCHGTAGRTATTQNPQLPAAPPVGTHGESATTDRTVGAHQRHLTDGTLANAVACTECHTIPTSTTHANGTVDMTFGTLAKTGGLSPAFNGTTCANTYCHGGSLEDGTLTAPTWTNVDGSQVACGTCHGVPPQNGRHATHVITRGIDCVECHGAGYSGTSATKTVNVTLHIDGATNVGGSGSSITAWTSSTGSCNPTCHNTRNW